MLHSTMEGGLKSAEDIVKIADQARHVIREVDPTVPFMSFLLFLELTSLTKTLKFQN